MIEAVCRSKQLLAVDVPDIIAFLNDKQNPDGGFRGRSKHSDIYYTLFASEALIALGAKLPAKLIKKYLKGLLDNLPCDLIHLASLIRCYADFTSEELANYKDIFVERLEQCHVKKDAGYECYKNSGGSSYGCFLALAAYQDLESDLPDPDGIIKFLQTLCINDGGYCNEPALPFASTPATAAAITTLHYLNAKISEDALVFLKNCFEEDGGCKAVAGAKQPDLLSTAVAIHSLSVVDKLGLIDKRPTLSFIKSLYHDGGFCAGLDETVLDCEYTYYGLLALGHLVD